MKVSPGLLVTSFLVVAPISFAQRQAPSPDLVSAPPAISEALRTAPFSCSSAPFLTCENSVTTNPSCLSGNYYLDLYSFSASQGRTVTITTTGTSSYQMLVTVQRRSDGTIVAQNNGYSPVSLTYTFPTTDTYYIGFGYVANFVTSSYSIVVHCGSSSTGCTNAGTITVPSLNGGTLNASTGIGCGSSTSYFVRYALSGTKDVPILLTYSTTGYDPYFEVEGTDSTHGVFAQSNTTRTIALTYLPSYTGTHYIYLGTYSNSQSGNYVLTADPAPVDPCRRRTISH